ncbi:MAG: hypothetical protein BJ554DRAFT_3497 [Olpidium bornovanus]|uniref:NOT2/NOT3/NOT5 C-terminal domain-containing protein n=1 Tax=Olpidium bornovanus TaxID=278681 RepID=A0A8H7ZNN6_9FUNG|nr:MAG: hypothetical protein BJ554DRAFT_3497 [Olpidium bornovanus]
MMGLVDTLNAKVESTRLLSLGVDLEQLGFDMMSSDTPTSPAELVLFTSSSGVDIRHIMRPLYLTSLPSDVNWQAGDRLVHWNNDAEIQKDAETKARLLADETLFYIFYHMPNGAMQDAAAQELHNRQWRWHKESRVWLMRETDSYPAPETRTFVNGPFAVFDPGKWQKVQWQGAAGRGSLETSPLAPAGPLAPRAEAGCAGGTAFPVGSRPAPGPNPGPAVPLAAAVCDSEGELGLLRPPRKPPESAAADESHGTDL